MTRFAWSMLLVLAACGGGAADGAADSQSPATARPVPTLDVQALRFSLSPPVLSDASTAAVQAKLESALLAVGYKLAADPAQSDIQIVVTTQTQFEASDFQVSFNGQPSGKNHVQVQVSLLSHGALVDRAGAEYRAPQGTVDDAAIAAVSDAITRSRRLKEFAVQLTAKQASQQQASADAVKRADDAKQQTDQRAARRDEDADWYRIRLEQCTVPSSLTSCDGVRGFLIKHPDGAHADEAKAALATATPKLEALQKDETAWTAAEPGACRRGDKDACAKVEIYLAKFPAGLHAGEAKGLTGGAP